MTTPKASPATRRREFWPERLAAYFGERSSQPFSWERNNCCLFACDGILAMTGIDPATKALRSGKTKVGVARILKKAGGVEAIAEERCKLHGFVEVSVKAAQRGDVVLYDSPEHGPALGLCDGMRSAFAGAAGLSYVPTLSCRRAWRVG